MSVALHHLGRRTMRPPSGRRTVARRVRRIGLGLFFASVAVNAAFAIYAVLTPDFGDTQTRMLLTSLCVTGTVLMALCCEPAWERRLLWHVPAGGALLGCAAFGGLIVGLWTEPGSETLRNLLWSTFVLAIACTLASVVVLERARTGISLAHERVLTAALALIGLGAAVACGVIWAQPSEDTIGNLWGSGWTVAIACVLAAFLTLARLAHAHRWVLVTTLGLTAVGAVLVIANIWQPDTSALTRAMGVVLIAVAAFAVTVPVLHWLDRGVVVAGAVTDEGIRYCPHCGGKVSGEVEVELECSRCGRGFTVVPTTTDLT